MCEKPLTKTLEEARALAAYAKEHNIITGVNFNCRWYPQVMQAKAMVDSGEVGDIYTVHGGYLQDWLYYDTDYSWRLEPEVSGDSRAFADIGSHWIDMVESVTGLRAVEVLADFETFHKTRKKPLKPVDTYSGMALRPRTTRRSPSTPRTTARCSSALTTAPTAPAPSARCLPGGRTRSSWTSAAARCALHWDSEDSNELWIGRRDAFNQKAPKDPSILSGLAARLYQLSRRPCGGLPRHLQAEFQGHLRRH